MWYARFDPAVATGVAARIFPALSPVLAVILGQADRSHRRLCG